MEVNFLGDTGIRTSRIALGCWSLIGDLNWGDQGEKESLATIEAALESGINFFDTAPGYGKGASEELLGRALRGRRKDAVLATKISGAYDSAQDLVRACEESLRRLQTDYIDLYQLHWANQAVPIDETVAVFERLQADGKIRAYGVCNFGVGDLTEFLRHGHCATNQIAYSLLTRSIEAEVQPKCMEASVGLLCYSPLAQGLLTGKFRSADEVPEGRARTRHFSSKRKHARHGEAGCEEQTWEAIAAIRDICERLGEPMEKVALAWLLAQPGVSGVLAGARRAEQVRQNATAAQLHLAPEVIDELTGVTERLKTSLGPNPDLWMASTESRMR